MNYYEKDEKTLIIDSLLSGVYIDFDINILKKYKDIESLTFRNMPINNELTKVISYMKNLKKLEFYNCSINSLEDFKDLPLISFLLSSTRVYNFLSISNLIKINFLTLNNMKELDLIAIAKLPNILGISLSSTPLDRSAFLSGFSMIENLSIDNTGLEDISFLESFPKLKYLNIDENQAFKNVELIEKLRKRNVEVDICNFSLVGEL